MSGRGRISCLLLQLRREHGHSPQRLRRDGYNAQTDAVYDAQQAIRVLRAYAKEFNIDPNKIGIMGFSAGRVIRSVAVLFEEFDKKNSDPGDPFAGISSRPDFVGIIYPGPTPFARNRTLPPIPRNVPPAFWPPAARAIAAMRSGHWSTSRQCSTWGCRISNYTFMGMDGIQATHCRWHSDERRPDGPEQHSTERGNTDHRLVPGSRIFAEAGD
jgi:hypothetical protein